MASRISCVDQLLGQVVVDLLVRQEAARLAHLDERLQLLAALGDLFFGERGLVEAELAHQRALLGARHLHAQRLGLGLRRRPRRSTGSPSRSASRSDRSTSDASGLAALSSPLPFFAATPLAATAPLPLATGSAAFAAGAGLLLRLDAAGFGLGGRGWRPSTGWVSWRSCGSSKGHGLHGGEPSYRTAHFRAEFKVVSVDAKRLAQRDPKVKRRSSRCGVTDDATARGSTVRSCSPCGGRWPWRMTLDQEGGRGRRCCRHACRV